jgi:hypothetical protein
MARVIFWEYGETLKSVERRIVIAAYTQCKFNTVETAKLLGLSDRTVRNKIQAWKRIFGINAIDMRLTQDPKERKEELKRFTSASDIKGPIREVKEALKPRPVMEPAPVRK